MILDYIDTSGIVSRNLKKGTAMVTFRGQTRHLEQVYGPVYKDRGGKQFELAEPRPRWMDF